MNLPQDLTWVNEPEQWVNHKLRWRFLLWGRCKPRWGHCWPQRCLHISWILRLAPVIRGKISKQTLATSCCGESGERVLYQTPKYRNGKGEPDTHLNWGRAHPRTRSVVPTAAIKARAIKLKAEMEKMNLNKRRGFLEEMQEFVTTHAVKQRRCKPTTGTHKEGTDEKRE